LLAPSPDDRHRGDDDEAGGDLDRREADHKQGADSRDDDRRCQRQRGDIAAEGVQCPAGDRERSKPDSNTGEEDPGIHRKGSAADQRRDGVGNVAGAGAKRHDTADRHDDRGANQLPSGRPRPTRDLWHNARAIDGHQRAIALDEGDPLVERGIEVPPDNRRNPKPNDGCDKPPCDDLTHDGPVQRVAGKA